MSNQPIKNIWEERKFILPSEQYNDNIKAMCGPII